MPKPTLKRTARGLAFSAAIVGAAVGGIRLAGIHKLREQRGNLCRTQKRSA